jgi:hypothetical protein
MSTQVRTPNKSLGRRIATLLAGVAGIASLAIATQANASILWSWGYSGSGIEARGTLTTADTPDQDGFYQVLGITGTRNGVAITGLHPTGSAIPGNEPFKVDNIIDADGGMTSHGIGYGTAAGTYANLFFATWYSPASNVEFFTSPDGSGGYDFTELPVTFNLSKMNAVPEPGGLALMAVAGLALALTTKRLRKSKDAGKSAD